MSIASVPLAPTHTPSRSAAASRRALMTQTLLSTGSRRGRPRRWLQGLFRAKTSAGDEPGGLRHQLEDLMETNGKMQAFSPSERALLENILELRDLRVADTMVPRADIMGLDLAADPAETMEKIVSGAHSRYPIYRDNLDDVLGFIHVKDVFRKMAANEAVNLEDLKRDVLIVSPTMPVLDLLPEMRAKRLHLAMVVDEFGGIDGLVTIEDLVELIVGEIQDEYDAEPVSMKVVQADGSWLLDARYDVEDLEAETGLELLDEGQRSEIDTLGGLVFDLAGQVPARGALIPHPCGLEFEVLEADARRIRRLKLRRLTEALAGVEAAR